jgi:hypothetical protein
VSILKLEEEKKWQTRTPWPLGFINNKNIDKDIFLEVKLVRLILFIAMHS